MMGAVMELGCSWPASVGTFDDATVSITRSTTESNHVSKVIIFVRVARNGQFKVQSTVT